MVVDMVEVVMVVAMVEVAMVEVAIVEVVMVVVVSVPFIPLLTVWNVFLQLPTGSSSAGFSSSSLLP